MNVDRMCPQCGVSIKPAMLKCMECGTRVTIQPATTEEQSATKPARSAAVSTSPAAQGSSVVRIVGRSSQPRNVLSPQPERPTRAAARHIEAANDTASEAGSFIASCECGARIRVADSMAGRRKRCRRCSQVMVLNPPATNVPTGPATVVPQLDEAPSLRIRLEAEIDRAIQRERESELASPLKKTLSSRKLAKLTDGLEVENPLSKREAIERGKVICQLGDTRDVRVLELITPLRSDSFETVREAVATAIGELGDPAGVDIVLRMLLDKDASVIRAALKAIRQLKHPSCVKPLVVLGLDNPLLKMQVSESLLQMSEVAVPELLEIVERQAAGMTLDAIMVLGRIGDERAVPALVDNLENASSVIRGYAVEALTRIGHRDALPRMIRLLAEDDLSVRVQVAVSLRRMPARQAVRPLLDCLLNTTDSELRRQVVLALGATKDPRSIPAISQLLPEADDPLREAIAEALGLCDDPAACAPLLSLVRDGNTELQLKALVGLKKSATAEALDELLLLANSPNGKVRRHAVEALAELAPPEATDLLSDLLLSDPVYDVRVAAAKALGQIGNPATAPTLERALRDEAPVRCAAVMALTRLGNDEVVPALIACLRDPAPEVRYHAVTGLGRLKAQMAASPVQAMLEDSDDMVRRGAEKALAELGVEPRKVSTLRRAAGRLSNLIPSTVLGSIPASASISVAIVVMLSMTFGAVFLLKDSIAGTPPHLILSRTEPVRQVCWVPDSSHVAVVRQSGKIEFWDAQSGEYLKGSGDVTATSVYAFGQPPQMLLQTSRAFSTWDYTQDDARPADHGPALPEGFTWVAPATNASICLVGMTQTPGQREFRIWAAEQSDAEPVVFTLAPEPAPAISGNGATVAGVVPQQGLFIFSTTTGKAVTRVEIPEATEHSRVTRLLLNMDGSILAGIADQEVLKVHLQNPKRPKATWINLNQPVSQFRFTKHATLTGIVRSDSVGRLDLNAGTLQTWPVTTQDVDLTTTASSSDGSQIVVSGHDEKLAWVVNTSDGTVHELSPVAIPGQ